MRLLLAIYNVLFPIVFLAMLPSALARMLRRGNYRHKFGQRFGIYSARVLRKLSSGGQGWFWIHAVSVGEVMVALRLIHALRARRPDARFVLSTTTSTGYRLAHRSRCEWFEPVYHPLDLPWAVARAFAAIRPRMLILVEAEVWPNAIARATRSGMPKVLVNARLSPRSEKRYRAVRRLASPLFNALDGICLQEPGDRERWLGLGVRPEKLRVMGSIKFDSGSEVPSAPRDFWPVLESLGASRDDPVIVGGSTFEGEEKLLASLFKTLRETRPRLFLVLVPRHAERGQSVLDRLRALGFDARLRTDPGSGNGARILVVNTTGELRDWYRCATVVFIGKSMARDASGGQNPAEAIAVGKPVVFGPGMGNFAALARQLTARGGAFQVADAAALSTVLARLLDDATLRRDTAAAGARCLEMHRGATDRTVEFLLSLAP